MFPNRSRRRAPVLLICLGLSLLMTGCAPEDPAATMLAEYRIRIARVVDVDLEPAAMPPLATWPRNRERTLVVPPLRAGLGRFLSLHRCDLGSLIGERSSQLGRVMRPSQLLSYEHRFLLAAERCLVRLEGDSGQEALRADLADIVAFKRERLPLLAWNATLGGEDLAGAHALDVPALPPDRTELAGQAEAEALRLLADRLPRLGWDDLDMAAWDAPWEVLSRSAFPGRARRGVQLLTHYLDEVARLLEARQAQRPLCPQGRPTRDADILVNVFRGYHADSVQPYLVAIDGAQRRWFAAIDTLAAAQRVTPPQGFAEFATEVLEPSGSAWQSFVTARQRHTAAWQDVLDRCALSPTAG
ncbi:MAG: DUF3080 family protein [Gammaproteobacteria bacterium]|nr:MAG: DUF3080 family protein [Gammaproteobacteria bacterium]